jgi:hypothetical protein
MHEEIHTAWLDQNAGDPSMLFQVSELEFENIGKFVKRSLSAWTWSSLAIDAAN